MEEDTKGGAAPGVPDTPRRRSLPVAILLAPVDAIVGVVVLLDAVAGPLFRPLLRWLFSLRIFAAAERGIAMLPPYGILALLAVPFALAEPLKIVSLWWIASGRLALGVTAQVFAHLMTLVVVDRIYHAGRHKLLTIGWFAWIMVRLAAVRDAVLGRMRGTALWRAAIAAGQGVRAMGRALRDWIGAAR
jgi:hypothetical protein